jgi:hypothetical protein
MKKLLYCLLICSSSLLHAHEKPKDNFCIPRHESKRYLTSDFSSAYPRTVKFECTYECQSNGRIDLVTGPMSVTVSSIEQDARDVVCQGVKIKKVPWGYDFDGVEAFYAYETSIKEVKAFAFAHINRNNAKERELLTNLRASLLKVAGSYQTTGVQAFMDAAKILTEIGQELPGSTKLLDKYSALILSRNGVVKLEASSESLILSSLSALAAWRMPIHLYRN